MAWVIALTTTNVSTLPSVDQRMKDKAGNTTNPAHMTTRCVPALPVTSLYPVSKPSGHPIT